MINEKIKFIAFYLPQFHPIIENDSWWGKGFTEWRNVAKAKPLFPGHKQPVIPGDLGFYDLRVAETRVEQAELAKGAGIAGFCYYNYYYSGRLLLEKILELILSSKKPDFPFCICWANHDWSMHWTGQDGTILIKQEYGDSKGITAHYNYLRKYFLDQRYILIENKPVLTIFKPGDIPNIQEYVRIFNQLAIDDGFSGVYFIAHSSDEIMLTKGFSALAPHTISEALAKCKSVGKSVYHKIMHKVFGFPSWVLNYSEFIKYFANNKCDGISVIPTVIPNFDNTPRMGKNGVALKNPTPELFEKHIIESIEGLNYDHLGIPPIVFIKSWNEWAEGNYLEPDLNNGSAFLDVIKKVQKQ